MPKRFSPKASAVPLTWSSLPWDHKRIETAALLGKEMEALMRQAMVPPPIHPSVTSHVSLPRKAVQ
jgi:hypothetical protein